MLRASIASAWVDFFAKKMNGVESLRTRRRTSRKRDARGDREAGLGNDNVKPPLAEQVERLVRGRQGNDPDLRVTAQECCGFPAETGIGVHV